MRPFRNLLRSGYRDAAEQSGAGIEPTFPANWRLPPFIAIDHILSRSCTATSLRTIKIPGSDHRGLAATVMIPRSSPSPYISITMSAAKRLEAKRRWIWVILGASAHHPFDGKSLGVAVDQRPMRPRPAV